MGFLKSIAAASFGLVLMAESAGATASLTLGKTVGTDPAVCAAADAITVTAGTDVTYCYRISNDSGISLTAHDLFDDKLGVLLTQFPFALPSGSNVFLTATTTIQETTVNVATWTASNLTLKPTATGGAQGWGPPAVITYTASDSCIVNVQVPPTESGSGPNGCTDGIDNDQDGAVDCGDTDCVSVGPCVAPAPVLSPAAMVAAGLILLSIGASSLLRSRRS